MGKYFEADLRGYEQVMNSDGILNMLEKQAEELSKKACDQCSPDNMERDPFASGKAHKGKKKGVAYIYTNSVHGRRAQAKNNVLQKVLKGG